MRERVAPRTRGLASPTEQAIRIELDHGQRHTFAVDGSRHHSFPDLLWADLRDLHERAHPRASGGEQRQDLVELGEAAGIVLREQELPVDHDVELSLPAGSDGRRDPGPRLDVVRETRGACVVSASGGAVEDLDLHGASLSSAQSSPPVCAQF